MRPHYAGLACGAAYKPWPGAPLRPTHLPLAPHLGCVTARSVAPWHALASAPCTVRGITGQIESFDFAARKDYLSW
jgi:hypothetical protein